MAPRPFNSEPGTLNLEPPYSPKQFRGYRVCEQHTEAYLGVPPNKLMDVVPTSGIQGNAYLGTPPDKHFHEYQVQEHHSEAYMGMPPDRYFLQYQV